MFPPILHKIFNKRILLSQHLLLYSCESELLNDTLEQIINKYLRISFHPIKDKYTTYLNYESIYLFDIKKCKEDKCDLLSLIQEISLTKNHFTKDDYKYIFLKNFHESNEYLQKGLKSYLDKYPVIFILLSSKFSKIQRYILSHVLIVRIPLIIKNKKQNDNLSKLENITGKKIILTKDAFIQKHIRMYKDKLNNKERIRKIRDISYEFLNSGYSLCEYLQIFLGIILKNLIMPLSVKEKTIKDISFCETLYEKCFRKGVLVEYIFLKLYDNVKYYTHYL